ncbi:MAG: HEPN domain-containing protein [Theionarchaea archaeon]|nr:HEPN domain-containing protein [Theionarchaea archaeon]
MGSARDKFRDFAIAFWKASKKDLERAQDALKEDYHPYAVFHSQQGVEKVVKALLEMEEVFVRDHDVSDMFATYVLKKEEDEKIKKNLYGVLDVLDWFKGAWTLSRYPVMEKGEVVSPFEQYDKKDAQYAVEKAKFAFDIVSDILKDRYGLEAVYRDINEGELGKPKN